MQQIMLHRPSGTWNQNWRVKMSTITIFANSKAVVSVHAAGIFDYDEDAIALIQCDDSYDHLALAVQGHEKLNLLEKRANHFKNHFEITRK